MMKDKLSGRIKELIRLADETLATRRAPSEYTYESVDKEKFFLFRTASLSFIGNLYEKSHNYYIDFEELGVQPRPSVTLKCRGILKAIESEIDGGWLYSLKDLVSAEIFSDFLEMAEYLLSEGYKDAAAVMIGSVVEESLRQHCNKRGLEISVIKDGREVPKKADLLNSELAANKVYNKLQQKNITAWLDLRNKAAHGLYNDYSKQQVEIMYSGVVNFVATLNGSY